MDDNLNKTLNKLDETLKNMAREVTSSLDNESPKWNASHIGDIPLDITHKKNGWGLLYNDGKFDMFPIGESKFYEHNELSGYKKEEHIPLNDSKTSTQNLWSSKRTLEEIIKETNKLLEGEIKEAKKQSNITLNKTVKKNRVEIERNIEDVKRQATMLLKRLEGSEVELSIAKDNIAKLGALRNDNSGIEQLWRQISTLETQLSALVDLKVGKVRDVVYTKGELNRKFKEVSERITRISKKTSNGKLTDEEIKNLIEDKTPWGHEHMAKEVKYNGQRLSEYLDNLSVGDGLPDQTGNSGKYLTTDGTDASWATLAGGGDMAAATYDPQGIAGDAFSTDNHTDGTTNKVFTATEKTKLSGIAESANNYSLPTAAAGTLGGVKVGTRLTITDGVLSADSQTDNNFTTTLKNKLDGIEAGAEANVVDSVNGQTGVVSLDIDDIAPTQTGNSGKVLKTDGTNVTWQDDATGAGGVDDGDKGDITVSASGATWTIDNSAVTYAKIQNVSATDRILGRDTAGAGVVEELTPTAVRSMINVADGANAYVHPNHSGDVTSVADGATTIANDAVTYAKMQNVSAENKILGRITTGAGNVEELTATNVRTIINVADGANAYVHPNHSGDVTSVADGATTIANGAVSLAKMANLAANTIIGRVTASTGVPEALTAANVRTIINVADGADVTANATVDGGSY